jgi:Na+-translocating ferredoxin:NAD+ oxidoreductase subunit B
VTSTRQTPDFSTPPPAGTAPSLTDRIDARLPQTQCRRCGFPRCRDYAAAVATAAADFNRCPPGGDVTLGDLAHLLNRALKPLDPAVGPQQERRRARIDESRCIGCRKCLDACPVDAILGARKQMHTVLASGCSGCELCLPPCPVDCIDMVPFETGTCAPWPDYDLAETERWRRRNTARVDRLKAHKHRPPRETPSVAIDNSGRMRAEIREAVARVKARKQGGNP